MSAFCTATTESDGETVRCNRDRGHDLADETSNHRGVTSAGKDVVWSSITLRPPRRDT